MISATFFLSSGITSQVLGRLVLFLAIDKGDQIGILFQRPRLAPIVKPEITIGRGSRSVSVDLPIKGDPEVSRVHATLTLGDGGNYWLVAKGRNPTAVSGHEIPRGERIPVAPDEKISICSFTLRIQPK